VVRRCRAVGEPLRRIAIAQRASVNEQRAAISSERRDRGGLVGEQPRERVGCAQVVLVVAPDLHAGGRERHAVADAGQDVLQRPARARVIEDLVRGDQRQPGGDRARADPGLARHVIGAAMAREHRVQAIAERIAQLGDQARGGSGSPARRLASPPHSAITPLARSQTSRHDASDAPLSQRRRAEVKRRMRFAQPARSIASSTRSEDGGASAMSSATCRGFARLVRPRRPSATCGVSSSVSADHPGPRPARGPRRDRARPSPATRRAAIRAERSTPARRTPGGRQAPAP